jgi:hypothetical protein
LSHVSYHNESDNKFQQGHCILYFINEENEAETSGNLLKVGERGREGTRICTCTVSSKPVLGSSRCIGSFKDVYCGNIYNSRYIETI